MEVCNLDNANVLPNLPRMKSNPKRRNLGKYYDFYKDFGHNTDECRELKMPSKMLLGEGILSTT